MSLNQLEGKLRLVARERIEAGKLPNAVPSRMWGGKGAGKPCALCDTIIEREDTELEVEERLGDKLETFHFHILCQSLWQLECVRQYHLKQKLKT